MDNIDLINIVSRFMQAFPGQFTVYDGEPGGITSSVTLYAELMTYPVFINAVKTAVLMCPSGVTVDYSMGRVTFKFAVGVIDGINESKRV